MSGLKVDEANEVAARLRESELAIETAAANVAGMIGTMLAVSRTADFAVATGQEALARSAQTLTHIVAARGTIGEAHAELLDVARASGIEREMNFGSMGGKPIARLRRLRAVA